jgi:hypothetical protein
MDRQFILVTGNQRQGKSVWAKLFSQRISRLLVSDPTMSYRNVDYETPPDEWLQSVITRQKEQFRFGTYYAEELPMFGHAAFAAGNCTLIIEECALIFRRGEELHEWAKPLIFMGGHSHVDLVLVAQRAASIPINIRSQATRIVTFKQSEPADVDALADRIGKSVKEVIPTLDKLECLDWDGDQVRHYTVRPDG